MPSNTISRTNIRVRRADRNGSTREFPSIAFAYRQLLGTEQELGHSEHQRIRAALRRGQTMRDQHGNVWSAVGTVQRYAYGFTQPQQVPAQRAAVADAVRSSLVEGEVQWSDLTFGVEIECMQADLSDQAISSKLAEQGYGNWRVTRDGSLGSGGHEVISPILKGQAGLDALRAVMSIVKQLGCAVDNRCGMHVHVGARDLSVKALRNLSLNFLAAEEHFDSVVQRSRRGSINHYCQSNRQHSAGAAAINEATTVRQLAIAMNGGWDAVNHYTSFRYRKLNFQSYAMHGTVEFRQHGGTVEAEKACQWVRLITGFVAGAANAGDNAGQPMTFEQFVGHTDESGQRYFTSRRNMFAAGAERSRAAA